MRVPPKHGSLQNLVEVSLIVTKSGLIDSQKQNKQQNKKIMKSSNHLVNALLSLGVDLIMIFGSVIGYVDQYRVILQEKNSEAFSKLISLILMLSNILRIFFWFGKRFDNVLLYQSLVMIVAQFVMLHVCCKYPSSSQKVAKSLLEEVSTNYFWNWPDMISYIAFIGLFSTIVGVTSGLLIPVSPLYVEVLGYAALMIEATLGLPQLIQNYKRQNTEGFSMVLLGTFFLGDTFKTVTFIARGNPMQFIACGVFQLLVDFALLYQVLTYQGPKKNRP